jgi:putative transposase
MDWKRLLAYISGSVDQELLLRNEYLVAENRILRQQVKGRLRLTDGERRTLAEIGKRLGKKGLDEVATVVKPATILAWHRRMIAKKFDGSIKRSYPGRPRTETALEALIVRLAKENQSWGYDRIVGALANIGYTISSQTVGNILKNNGLAPAPERKKTTSWKDFIRRHKDLLVSTDFFTTEVWTFCGLVTYYILFFIRINTREVHMAGLTPHPNQPWMTQIARNVTMVDLGFLMDGEYLIHDWDGKYCRVFQTALKSGGVRSIPLPARSPNLNAYAERWVRSIKDECLSKVILFGERSLRHALREYMEYYHRERNHQGRGNVLLLSSRSSGQTRDHPLHCRERLGGLLKYYYRKAA